MKRNAARLGLAAAAGALSLFLGAAPANASLVANGVTYTLTETLLNPTTAEFTLQISGINGASDNEGGRSGVNAFAFAKPTNFVSASFVSAAPVQGFTYQAGGLNSDGCNGAGNFYCFAAITAPPNSPALAANSTLSFTFDVTISSGSFADYTPTFKIDWVGSKNNYSLVGLSITLETTTPETTAIPVPEPMSLALFGSALLGLGMLGRRRSA